MTTLLLGAAGQLGTELLRALQAHGQPVIAATRSGQLADGRRCEAVDLAQPAAVAELLERVRPDSLINAAAYTAVDQAESEPAAAWCINARLPELLAQWCAAHDALLVHYSTDYVFDGRGTRPYREDDATAPLGVYGASKLAGEQAIVAAGCRHAILRTAWVYAAHGRNFLRTMLRLAGERDQLKVVDDQVGTPTSAALIASTTLALLPALASTSGIWHLTASGQCSWNEFAQEIFARAREIGLLDSAPEVVPIPTGEYPTPARRPAYSVLDTSRLSRDFALALPHWRDALLPVLEQLHA